MITAQSICNTLNRLFKADPVATHALMVNRIPASENIINDPWLICNQNTVLPDNNCSIGILGIINGILWENYDPELVAMKFTPKEENASRMIFTGFTTVENLSERNKNGNSII